MEKDKFLDTISDPKIMANTPIGKSGIVFCFLVTLCLFFVIYGCSLPRVIILEDPLTPEEHLNLGVAYEGNGEFENAIREYRLAAKKLPLAYLYLGNVHFQREEFDKAEKYYRKSIRKEPNNADAYNNLAWLYYVKGENLDKAEALALKAMELNSPKISVYRDTLDKIRERKGAMQ